MGHFLDLSEIDRAKIKNHIILDMYNYSVKTPILRQNHVKHDFIMFHEKHENQPAALA